MTTPGFLTCVLWASAAAAVAPPKAVEEHVRDLGSDLAAVRANAAAALGTIDHSAAVPALVKALRDPQGAVRREAAKALGTIKDPRAADALAAALADEDGTARFHAAHALGEIRDPGVAEALLGGLGDASSCVRDQAAWALRGLADPSVVGRLAKALEDDRADAAHVVWILRHIGGERAVGALASLLASRDAWTRERAVRALGELGAKSAAGPLVTALSEADASVRRRAVAALVAIGGDESLAALEDLAARETDPSVRDAAREAVARMSRDEALAAHWSFDDGSRKVARDVTGGGTDGEIIGCAPVEGRAGRALRFREGTYIELGKPALLQIGGRPFTVMAWVKSDAANGVVVARGGAFCGYSLYIKDGRPKFGIHRVQDGPAYIAAGREKVVGRWVHVAGVVRKDRVELYVDAKPAATAKTPGYIPGECGQGMEIGFDAGNSPAEIVDNFVGVIDEVKVFNEALSAAEIAKRMRVSGK
ncbi:MAG: HEAT repeat domain-containing protein [Planctomycetota bacterium]|jgi:HEAT repeat protein